MGEWEVQERAGLDANYSAETTSTAHVLHLPQPFSCLFSLFHLLQSIFPFIHFHLSFGAGTFLAEMLLGDGFSAVLF